jgi:hypothetical protein
VPELDRRPWLILSKRECAALRTAAFHLDERKWDADLERAVKMIEAQMRWINGDSDRHEPSRDAAIERDALRARDEA